MTLVFINFEYCSSTSVGLSLYVNPFSTILFVLELIPNVGTSQLLQPPPLVSTFSFTSRTVSTSVESMTIDDVRLP